MSEQFNLPVIYQGQEQEFEARFEQWAYSHRFIVLIGETSVNFEPDEDGGYRAVAPGASIAVSLLQAIAQKLVSLSQ